MKDGQRLKPAFLIRQICVSISILLPLSGGLLVVHQSENLSQAIMAVEQGRMPRDEITVDMNHVPNLRPLADSVVVKKTPSGVVCYWNDSDPLPVKPSDFVFPLVIYGVLCLMALFGYWLIRVSEKSGQETRRSQDAIGGLCIISSILMSSVLLFIF